jgi:hypothetical protein
MEEEAAASVATEEEAASVAMEAVVVAAVAVIDEVVTVEPTTKGSELAKTRKGDMRCGPCPLSHFTRSIQRAPLVIRP